jgi:hypothetical protein
MAKLISVSIDLNKIDKTKIIANDKNGQPFANGAKYLNLTVSVNDKADDYGNDCSISINQSKEEREAQIPKIFLGNGKTIWSSENSIPNTQSVPKNEPSTPLNKENEPNDLGF